jgi:hypothetical protein
VLLAVPKTCWFARVAVAPAPKAAELAKLAREPEPMAVLLVPVPMA